MIDSILTSIRAIIEFIIILLFYRQIYNAEIIKNKGKVMIYCLGMAICYFVNAYFDIGLYFTVIGTLYGIVIPLILLEGNKRKWIFLYPTMILMVAMICMCISYALAIVLNASVSKIYYRPSLAVVIDILFLALFIIEYLIDKMKNNRINRGIKITVPVYVFMLVGEVCFWAILGAMQYFTIGYNAGGNLVNVMGFIVSAVCIAYCLGFMFLSASIQKNLNIKRENDMINLYADEQQKHIKLMVEKDSDIKKFRHDVRQHMWVVSYHLDEGNVDKAKEYISQIYEALDNSKMEHYTGVIPIDVAISDKKRIMDEKNIVFNWSGNVQKIPDDIKEYDMCTVFVGVLDKAIYACEKLPEEERELKLVVEVNNGKLYIREKHKSLSNDKSWEDRQIKGITEKYNGYVVHTIEDGNCITEIVI